MIKVSHLRVENQRLGQRRARFAVQHELVLTLIFVEQGRSIVAKEEEVGVTAVREIGEHGAAHSSLGGFESGAGGLLRKRSVAIVTIEVHRGAGKIVRET